MNQFFNEIHGQSKAANLLKTFFDSGKIPHALLFSGNDGVGKFFTALQFAKLINSSDHPKNHHHIGQISKLTEPYIKYIIPLPRGKSETNDSSPTEKLSDDQITELKNEISAKIENPYHRISIDKAFNIKISSIREIRKFLSLNFDEVKYRVIIIEEASKMNSESQNALLKSLEEPPERVIFILVTSEPDALLPTIKSRCWEIKFEPLSLKDVESVLVDYFNTKKDVAKKVSYFANGSVSSALTLLENDFKKLVDKTIVILRYSLARKYYTASDELNSILNDMTAQNSKNFLQMILLWLSDVQRNRAGLEIIFFTDHSDTIVKFNQKFSDVDIKSLFTKIDRLNRLTDNNVNLNIITMNIIFEIASTGMR